MIAKKQIMITASESFEQIGNNIKIDANYAIERDGTVINITDPCSVDNSIITVCLANGGPIKTKNRCVPDIPFYEYCEFSPYRGNIYYEAFPTAQTNALKNLLFRLISEHNIVFKYDYTLSVVCQKAINGEPGIFFASSYDKNRTDIHPQPNIIKIIKSLAI